MCTHGNNNCRTWFGTPHSQRKTTLDAYARAKSRSSLVEELKGKGYASVNDTGTLTYDIFFYSFSLALCGTEL